MRELARILVCDDEKMIVSLISDALKDEGYEVDIVYNGKEAINVLHKESYDLIILDIMMPEIDGYSVVKQVRDIVQCPILFVTAKARTLDTLLGLELGADDYITKPFVIEELIARVKAHLRREKRNNKESRQEINFGDLKVYPDSMEVFIVQELIELSSREFSLLLYLIENSNRVLTREQIFDSVWGIDYSDIGAVTVTIKNLRDKLDPDNRMIKTVWGMGYKMVNPLGKRYL